MTPYLQKDNLQKKETQPIKIRPHFQVLDGLRGIAALAVVVFHFIEWIYTDAGKNFIGHGFLAVDFFFCLSGFVIGYAYDERFKNIGIKQFFKRRLIRLQPMVIFGSVIGLLAFLFNPFADYQHQYSTVKILLIFLCSVLMIPLPVMGERSFNNFGLNAPSWSLFWEYVANIFYALFLVRLRKLILLIIHCSSLFSFQYCVSKRQFAWWMGRRKFLGWWGKDLVFISRRLDYFSFQSDH